MAESIEGNVRLRRSALARDFKRMLNAFNRRQRTMLNIERDLLAGDHVPERIVGVSRYVVEQLRQHYGLGPDRVSEVFNAVSVAAVPPEQVAATRAEVRSEWGLATSSFVMLFVGHNFKLKGLAQMIDAAGVLAQRQGKLDWHLLVLGRDKPRPFVARADRWGITGRIAFIGAQRAGPGGSTSLPTSASCRRSTIRAAGWCSSRSAWARPRSPRATTGPRKC